MEHTLLKDTIVNILDEKSGDNIITIDVAKKTSIADYFVIATGKNTSHVKALADNLEAKLEPQGVFVLRKEGVREGRWVVLDYGSVIVHIFNDETRDFYALEKLYMDK